MNPKTVRHLFSQDFRRLWRGLVAVWIWLVFCAVQWMQGKGFGPFDPGTSQLDKPNHLPPSESLNGNTVFCACAMLWIAADLGMGMRRWTPLAAVRRTEAAAACALGVIAWLVLPQVVVASAVSSALGIDLSAALMRASEWSRDALLALLAVGMFGSWCGSPRRLGAGILAVVALHAFCQSLPGVTLLPMETFTGFVMGIHGVPCAWIGVLGIAVSLGIGGWLLRSRLSPGKRVVAAVLLTVSPMACHGWLGGSSRAHDDDGVQPTISELRAEADPASVVVFVNNSGPVRHIDQCFAEGEAWDRNSGGLVVGAAVKVAGCPESCFPRWNPGLGEIWKAGRKVAEGIQRPSKSPTGLRVRRSEDSPALPADERAAILACVPNDIPPLESTAATRWENKTDDPSGIQVRFLGLFQPVTPDPDWDRETLLLRCSLEGAVWRYERVLDVMPGKEVIRKRIGDATYEIRILPEVDDGWCEVRVLHPAGPTERFEKPESGGGPPPLLVYCPESGGESLLLEVMASGKGWPLGGVAWEKRIFGHRWLENHRWYSLAPGLTDPGPFLKILERKQAMIRMKAKRQARIFLLEPRRVARVSALPLTAKVRRQGPSSRELDLAASLNDPRSEEDEVGHLPIRGPDPRTCGRDQFAKWLVTDANWWRLKQSHDNLAPYARPFGDVVARMPTSGRSGYLGGFPVRALPARLLPAFAEDAANFEFGDMCVAELALRGNLDSVREGMLDAWAQNTPSSYHGKTSVMLLEDKKSYGRIIDGFISGDGFQDYWRLCLMPEMKPQLDNAIRLAAESHLPDTQPPLPSHRAHPGPLWIYPIAARNGSAKALDAVLRVCGNTGLQYDEKRAIDSLFDVPDGGKRESGWAVEEFKNKRAEDFTYQPETMRWKSTTPTIKP